ncbi:MAG: single-stranded-DNA-specific exonuclease RecJ [Bacteroidales bacterium]|nr:single-stranded-DNA-specific exonuclease RecJ [Bacteroidales bacterium]MBN2757964.1 single-stranded-DNA-specific exonuclease RecJ [Bacteroidales bacterium]
MEQDWILKPNGNQEYVDKLSEELTIEKPIANMLVQRGITTFEQAKSFFRPSLDDLHDPFLMKDMDKAIARLENAIINNEKILIYGDYDVDGTTSVALVYSYLKEIYRNIDYYIPDRYSEGYGISFKGIDYAEENKQTLVIALDCGIKANDKIVYANNKNIDFIICDHHNPGEKIPDAVAVLDPKRLDCDYPFDGLSGCGVGFKFLQAFSQKKGTTDNLWKYLDLVAVSIASDIVPITGENRTLAHFGLKQLNNSPRIGLKSILDFTGLLHKDISIADCVFKIGPRINAAGRIESGNSAVKLLTAQDEMYAFNMSSKINNFNETRQNLDRIITREALEMIESNENLKSRKSNVLYKKDWHKGVIGIVASRIIESYFKPTIILTESNGKATGSARSVNDFNLYDAIDECSDLLESFGGHMHAAGLTLKIENIQKFSEKFEAVVSRKISEDQLIPKVNIDSELNFSDITPKFYRIIKQFAPFGPGNMSPVYKTDNIADAGFTKIVGKDEEHLKLDLIDKTNSRIQGIGFNMAGYFKNFKQKNNIDICYSIDENEFLGKKTLQLRIKGIKINSK